MKEPLYARAWRCLFCGTSFEAYLMYASARAALEHLDDRLDSPWFDASCNYLHLDVKVCPSCAFASNDPRQFDAGSDWTEPMKPGAAAARQIEATRPARTAMAARAPTLSSRERTAADALTAYRIAMQCAGILGKHQEGAAGVEAYRAANYAIRAARLCEEAGRHEERRTHLEVARGFLRKAAEGDLTGVALYRSLYQLGALAIVFGDDKTASFALESLRGRTEEANELLAYRSRLKRLWEDREEIRKETGDIGR